MAFTDPEHAAARSHILSVLPERAQDLERLETLIAGGESVVTAIGKYNHGKSRLLNEVLGIEAFAVADKRETTVLSAFRQNGACWLDAPGFDADAFREDDHHALRAAWVESDIRLFVHSAKEGELDAKEAAFLAKLRVDEQRTRRQTLFVLSQVDQVADDATLEAITGTIGRQAPDLVWHAVSATRHHQGLQSGKTLLVTRSGIPALRQALDHALVRVAETRVHEMRLLEDEISADLERHRAAQEHARDALLQACTQRRQSFDEGLEALLERVAGNIGEVIDAPVPDHAVVADTFQDRYRMTDAKRERARIQIVYSRACILIEAFLVGQGVVGLPNSMRATSGSMNTVMVAVLGVSVKYRSDLRARFCEPAGRARLQRDFTRYFELSEDRETARAAIAGFDEAIAATGRALAMLRLIAPDA